MMSVCRRNSLAPELCDDAGVDVLVGAVMGLVPISIVEMLAREVLETVGLSACGRDGGLSDADWNESSASSTRMGDADGPRARFGMGVRTWPSDSEVSSSARGLTRIGAVPPVARLIMLEGVIWPMPSLILENEGE